MSKNDAWAGKEPAEGRCCECHEWSDREKMRGMNVHAYLDDGSTRRIRLRFCPPCFAKKLEALLAVEFDARVHQRPARAAS